MSALWTGLTGWQAGDSGTSIRPSGRLRSVPDTPPRLARRPFAIVLIILFGVGMTGLLMLNTTLQNQAFESRTLNRQATELAHVEVDLQTQLDAIAAAPELARRASDLGMRANPKPAFLVVPSGKVIGKPYRVKGDELPGLIVKTKRELAADDAAAAAKRARKAADKVVAARAEALQAERKAIDEAEAKARAEKATEAQSKTDQKAKKNTSSSRGNR